MIINNNINALNTYNKLNNATKIKSESMEKVSSGLRINRAADDAGGASISEKMRAQIRGLEQAGRNIQDGVSLVQTAESGLGQIENPNLQRMRELCVQAANGTLTSEDREKIQNEINEIKNSVNDIANNTEFNTIKLLDGSNPCPQNTSGTGSTTSNYNYENSLVFNGCVGANGNFQFRTNEGYPTTDADNNQILVYGGGSTSWPKVNIDGTVYTLGTTSITPTVLEGNSYKTVYTIPDKNVQVTQYVSVVKDKYEIRYAVENKSGEDHNIGIQFHVDTKLGGDDFAPFIVEGNPVPNETAYTTDIPDSFIVYNQTTGPGANAEFQATGILKSTGDFNIIEEPSKFAIGRYDQVSDWDFTPSGSVGDSGYSIWWDQRNVSSGGNFEVNTFYGMSIPPTITDPNEQNIIEEGPFDIKLQVGANAGEIFSVELFDAKTTNLGIDDVVIDPFEEAENSIGKIDKAIETVSYQRAKFGAYQNALEHINTNVNNYNSNLTVAQSRIEDVDIAKEIIEVAKNGILEQSSQALLKQAQDMPQSVLNLIKSWGQNS